MRIIILGPSYPYRGGIAAFNERLARELIRNGNEVELWTFTLQYPSFLFPGKTQYSAEPAPEGLSVRRVINSVYPLNWISVGMKLRKVGPDFVIVPFWLPFMAPSLGMVSRIARGGGHTRIIGILHNLIPHEHRMGDFLFCHYFIRSLDGAVALSKKVAADIDRFNKSLPRIFTPHPLYDIYGSGISKDEACRFLKLDSSMQYVLFFGLIRDYKGLDLLLDAFSCPGLRGRKIRLIVAGEFYGDGTKYLEQAEKLGIGDAVIWHTYFVPDDEVRYFFSAADVIVQPYKSATQSGVTQIAYHFGKPMIVTDTGGLPEMVPDGKAGHVVKPQADAIADAVVKFYEKERPDAFAEGIMEEKKKYSWEGMSRAVNDLYEKICCLKKENC